MTETLKKSEMLQLGVPVALATGAALLANAYLIDAVRKPENTHIQGENTTKLAVAGLNNANADAFAEAISTDCSSFHYASRGFTLEEAAEAFSTFYANHDREKPVDVYCQSLGALATLKTAVICQERGWHLPKIRSFTAVSSPFKPEDVRNARLYKIPSLVPPRLAGFVGKVVGEGATHIGPELSPQALAQATKHALRSPRYGATPSTWNSTLRILYDKKHDVFATGALAKIFDTKTRITYIYDSEDRVVDANLALKNLQFIADTTGAHLEAIEVPRMGHANYRAIPEDAWTAVHEPASMPIETSSSLRRTLPVAA